MITNERIKEIEKTYFKYKFCPRCDGVVDELLNDIVALRKIAEAFIAAYNEPVHIESGYNQLIDYVKEAYDQWCEAR